MKIEYSNKIRNLRCALADISAKGPYHKLWLPERKSLRRYDPKLGIFDGRRCDSEMCKFRPEKIRREIEKRPLFQNEGVHRIESIPSHALFLCPSVQRREYEEPITVIILKIAPSKVTK